MSRSHTYIYIFDPEPFPKSRENFINFKHLTPGHLIHFLHKRRLATMPLGHAGEAIPETFCRVLA